MREETLERYELEARRYKTLCYRLKGQNVLILGNGDVPKGIERGQSVVVGCNLPCFNGEEVDVFFANEDTAKGFTVSSTIIRPARDDEHFMFPESGTILYDHNCYQDLNPRGPFFEW